MPSYRETLEYILSRTDFERDRGTPYNQRDWRLTRVEELLAQLGKPHRAYPSVHIAGTKGKGSTTAMVDSILRAAGYRVGMYTSPHLHTFRERIQLQGRPIPEEDLVTLVEEIRPIVNARPKTSVFELITALAMWHFARQEVDLAVFEVGLGGRLDATNVLTPLVSLITSISIDHIGVLGTTLAQIAREKAGIIKPDVPVVSSPQRPSAMRVIRETAAAQQAPLTIAKRDWRWRDLGPTNNSQRLAIYRAGSHRSPEYPELWLPLLGKFQLENACTAVAGIEALREQDIEIPREAVHEGLAQVYWPGRMQVLSREPLVVVDGAHNAYSVSQLIQSLPAYLEYQRIRLIFGAGQTHRPASMLELLLPQAAHAYVTAARHPKSASPEMLRDLGQELGYSVEICATTEAALRLAVREAGPDELILVTGSLFIVAEALSAWEAMQGRNPFPSDPPGIY